MRLAGGQPVAARDVRTSGMARMASPERDRPEGRHQVMQGGNRLLCDASAWPGAHEPGAAHEPAAEDRPACAAPRPRAARALAWRAARALARGRERRG